MACLLLIMELNLGKTLGMLELGVGCCWPSKYQKLLCQFTKYPNMISRQNGGIFCLYLSPSLVCAGLAFLQFHSCNQIYVYISFSLSLYIYMYTYIMDVGTRWPILTLPFLPSIHDECSISSIIHFYMYINKLSNVRSNFSFCLLELLLVCTLHVKPYLVTGLTSNGWGCYLLGKQRGCVALPILHLKSY